MINSKNINVNTVTDNCDIKVFFGQKIDFYKQDNFLNTVIYQYNQVGSRIQSGIFIKSVLTESVRETGKT